MAGQQPGRHAEVLHKIASQRISSTPAPDEERKMTKANCTSKTIAVEHIRIASQRPFAEVRAALESNLSKLDASIAAALHSGDGNRAREYEASGPKLSIFLERDHGSLLEIAGGLRNAIQYDIG